MSGSETVMLHFRCPLPLEVDVAGVRWWIQLGYYSKGHRAEIYAIGSNGKRGVFYDGRASMAERAIGLGVAVPIRTVRHRLALALEAKGLAVVRAQEIEGTAW